MKKSILLIAIFFCALSAANVVYCQENNDEAITEAVQSVHTAYVKNDFKLFMENHSFFERLLAMDANNYTAKYYLAYIEYRLFSFKQSNTTVNVDKYYDSALEICKDLIDKKKLVPEINTVMAGLYMLHLAEDQFDAMTLMPRIFELLDEAEKAPGNNPRPLIIRGIMLLNVPPMFGGSIEKSIECFTKAVSMYETDEKKGIINWGYEEALAWSGRAFERNNQPEKARECYNKALKLAPEYSWVKFVLLPALDKTNKN